MVLYNFSVSSFHLVQKAFQKTTGWPYEDNDLILLYTIVFIVEFWLFMDDDMPSISCGSAGC